MIENLLPYLTPQNIEVIAIVATAILALISIKQTEKIQKSNFLLELIKQESSLQLEIRKAEPKYMKLYIEPYLNFFDGLALFWDKHLINDDAENYFKDIVLNTAETDHVQKYINKIRKGKPNAYRGFEELYKKLGGNKWLKKIKIKKKAGKS